MSLPSVTKIGGLPFRTVEKDRYLHGGNYVSYSSFKGLEIAIRGDLARERRQAYYLNEVAVQLLELAGFNHDDAAEYKEGLGRGLYSLLRENSFTWVREENLPLPLVIRIGLVTYDVKKADSEYMEGAGLLGEVSYTKLNIQVTPGLNDTITRWVLVHEMTHALLYDTGYPGDCNDDAIVVPLGNLLYQLLRENNFDFMGGRL
jgi:hypothetical protein